MLQLGYSLMTGTCKRTMSKRKEKKSMKVVIKKFFCSGKKRKSTASWFARNNNQISPKKHPTVSKIKKGHIKQCNHRDTKGTNGHIRNAADCSFTQ